MTFDETPVLLRRRSQAAAALIAFVTLTGCNIDPSLIGALKAQAGAPAPAASGQPQVGQAGQPGQPNQPGQPGQPGQPNQPGQPGQPNQPGQPGQPGMNQPQPGNFQPGQPGQPGQPPQPGMNQPQPGNFQPGQPPQPGTQPQPGMNQLQPGQPMASAMKPPVGPGPGPSPRPGAGPACDDAARGLALSGKAPASTILNIQVTDDRLLLAGGAKVTIAFTGTDTHLGNVDACTFVAVYDAGRTSDTTTGGNRIERAIAGALTWGGDGLTGTIQIDPKDLTARSYWLRFSTKLADGSWEVAEGILMAH